jgi:hypothetical protein
MTEGEYLAVLRKDPCAYCGRAGGVIDHIEPRVTGGADDTDNLTGACHPCNGQKSALSLLGFLGRRRWAPAWRAALAHAGQRKSGLDLVLAENFERVQLWGQLGEEWCPNDVSQLIAGRGSLRTALDAGVDGIALHDAMRRSLSGYRRHCEYVLAEADPW